MPIITMIVKEDLNTVVKICESIDINKDFHYLQGVARELKLYCISTIDEAGNTIINQPQMELFTQEIRQLRQREDINQDILDKLQNALDAVSPYSHKYIKFEGD